MRKAGDYKGLACLIALLVVAPYATYKATFSATTHLWSSTREMQKDIRNLRIDNAEETAGRDGAFETGTDMILNGELMVWLEKNNALHGMSVEKYTPHIFQEKDGLNIQTAEIVLTGPYKDALKTIRSIETGMPLCKMSSAGFKTISSRQNNDIQLQTTLIIQQLTEK